MERKDRLLQEVLSLIQSKREDEWWDFKQQHHKDKAELLHDIICMANNRAKRDSYIIFGVEDETFKIVGVENTPNRRNQQNIVDFLRGCSFAGGARPRIELHTFEIEQHEIDVLIIKDSDEVPYYLEKEYRDVSVKNSEGMVYGKIVRPYIYTRTADNNTPINKCADINDVENLWRRHFGIDLSAMERLDILLNDTDKWKFDWGNKNYCYHCDFPEFQIVQVEDMKPDWTPAAAFYVHPAMHSARLNILYHTTIIYETVLWSFDHYTKYLPKAEMSMIKEKGNFWYSYYLLDSFEGKMLKIFTKGSCDISSREPNYHQLLIFADESEKLDFDRYVLEHFDDYTDAEVYEKYEHQIKQDDERNGGGGIYSAFQVAKISMLYEDWLKRPVLELTNISE